MWQTHIACKAATTSCSFGVLLMRWCTFHMLLTENVFRRLLIHLVFHLAWSKSISQHAFSYNYTWGSIHLVTLQRLMCLICKKKYKAVMKYVLLYFPCFLTVSSSCWCESNTCFRCHIFFFFLYNTWIHFLNNLIKRNNRLTKAWRLNYSQRCGVFLRTFSEPLQRITNNKIWRTQMWPLKKKMFAIYLYYSCTSLTIQHGWKSGQDRL